MTTMSPELFRLLVLRPGRYEPIQAWCRKAWAGAAWGGDLAHAIVRENADEFLSLAVDAGWLTRGGVRRVPGFGDCGGHALPTRNGQRVIADPSHMPWSAAEYMYEPNREHHAYVEFVALTVLSCEYFERLTDRWRVYAERAESAALEAAGARARAATADRYAAEALARKLTAQRRARTIAGLELAFRRRFQHAWLNAIAAAVPHVEDPVIKAQLEACIWDARELLRTVPHENHAWTQAHADSWRASEGGA